MIDKVLETQIIEGTASSISSAVLNSVVGIRSYLFYQCDFASISIPNATYIQTCGMSENKSLTSASFQSMRSVESSSFIECTSLQSLSMPNLISAGSSAFGGSFTDSADITFPKLNSAGVNAFHCQGTIRLPALTTITENITSSIITPSLNLYLDNVTTIGEGCYLGTTGVLHIGNKLTTLNTNLAASEVWFHYTNSDAVNFTVENAVGSKGTSKSTKSYSYRTDNTTIKDRLIACGDSYTTITVKHIDGSDW